MGYQTWCEAVRLAILATAWLLVFINFVAVSDVPLCFHWCDKLRVCIYICCFIAGFSYRTRLVIKQYYGHAHIHDSPSIHNRIFQNFSYIYMAVVAHGSCRLM